ncbi:MAG: tyrosine-type recombinase/integrase [candidate division WOR-3 bacterium]|nr:tyrosine-type recombinase/integrase [candidate division WOR-3 bacterium]
MKIQVSKRQIFLIIAIAVGILLLIILAKKMEMVTGQPVLQRKSRHKRIREEREIRRLNAKSLDIGTGADRISVDVGIYRRENGMLYVRVMIDGKLIRRSLQTRKESEALLKIRSVIMAALECQQEKEVPKLAEFAKTYLEYSKRQHRTSTREKRTSRIRKLIENLGSMRLDQIDKRAIRVYYQKRLQEVSPASVNREQSLLSSIMEYAAELDLIRENPVRKVKKLRESPGRERYLTPDEIKRLLGACETLSERKGVGHNPILYEIVLTAILTGLRKGNLQKLRWSQVNLKTGLITIPAEEHKNRKPLYFPINPYLQEILLGLRHNYPYAKYVFCKADGTEYGDWKRSFNTAREIAGLKDVRFHDLRHTCGTLLNMLGTNQYTIRTLMGHRTLAASRRYVHTPPETVREASNALGDRLRRILDGSD